MWSFDGQVARADAGNLAIAVRLDVGYRSVSVHSADFKPLANLWYMPVVTKQPMIDVYVRDHDLICLLGPSELFPFHTHLYWTLRQLECSPAPMAALSLLVSVRTDLLDTHPVIEVRSDVPNDGLQSIDVAGGPAYLIPLNEQATLVDFATPEDCASQAVCEANNSTFSVERTMFDHFLEKGVIRSGRLFATMMSGRVDEHTTAHLCREMLAAELPLTT